MRHRWARSLALLATLALLLGGRTARADHPCSSPLVLDLDDDGVRTTGLDRAVEFDINGDGELDRIGWTFWESEEGFLWLDLNRNGEVDDGSELFGNSTLLPTGLPAENGFEALSVYDRERFGGDEDGLITVRDFVWQWLRLWVDRDHDGISDPSEIHRLEEFDVVSIGLRYVERKEFDGSLNLHRYQGKFVRRGDLLGRRVHRLQAVDDVFFVVDDTDPAPDSRE